MGAVQTKKLLRPLPTRRPQRTLIFLENPSGPETQETNPVPEAAASLGFEPRVRPPRSSAGSRISLQRKENRPCVCVLAAPGAGSRNAMCAQLKVGCPQRAPSTNLKRQGLAENQTRASWGFFFNLQAFRSCLEQSLLDWGSPDTHSFLNGLFCSQDLDRVLFPFPSFCEPKKERGAAPSLPACPCGRGGRPLARCPALRPVHSLRPGWQPGHRGWSWPRTHVATPLYETLAPLPQRWASWLDGGWLALISKGSESLFLCT